MKKIKIIILITIIILIIGIFGAFLGAGNRGYFQKYAFNCDKDSLINSLHRLKNVNQRLQLPKHIGFIDSYAEKDQYYYHSYFYWTDENRIIHLSISSKDNEVGKSYIYLEAVSEILTPGNWKIINKDFNRKDNLQVKLKFEKDILNKLNMDYTNEGNNMFIFWK